MRFPDEKPTSGLDRATEAAKPAGNRLVAAWQKGGDREEIFRQMFEIYARSVNSFFLKRGFSQEESQDLVQETFLKVYRGLPAFRGEARFETWLFQIAANLYRNLLRSQSTLKREAQEVPLDDVSKVGSDPAEHDAALAFWEGNSLDDLLDEERCRILSSALLDLPDQMRRCVELRVDQDLRYREIADLMSISIETVKAHLGQAKSQLKAKLKIYFCDVNF
jgi:RNA polymerase sigma-70 factor (ECF subfamily)